MGGTPIALINKSCSCQLGDGPYIHHQLMYGWATVPRFDDFKGLDEVMVSVRALNPFVHKGYVVVDSSDPLRCRSSSSDRSLLRY